MIQVQIVDSQGRPNGLKVNGEGELHAVIHQHPPKDEKETALPYRTRFTDSAGSSAMNVNGSTNNVEFAVRASPDVDIYLKTITVDIGDGGAPNLNGFGSLSALANGVLWEWDSQDIGEIELHEGIKTNKEFIRTGCGATGAIGTGADAYLADVSGGGSEKSYLPVIDLAQTFGTPWGIRLRKGTNDKMLFRVRDDLRGLTTFNAIAYGVQF